MLPKIATVTVQHCIVDATTLVPSTGTAANLARISHAVATMFGSPPDPMVHNSNAFKVGDLLQL
jgi:hypothetical protein